MAKSYPYKTTRYSVFACRPYERDPSKECGVYITLVKYCKDHYISRSQCYRLIRKKWIAVTRAKGRLYVKELCPELLEAYYKNL